MSVIHSSSRPTDRVDASRELERFFQETDWKPFRFQRSTWRAYLDGASGLVHSATGTGKTLAVWMGPILKWIRENPDRSKWRADRQPPLRVLWITPLRALAGDTENSLRAPLDFLQLPWRLESRTGDSKPGTKARQLKRLPTALVTTPESLSLMLTHQTLQEQISGLECVIVDEWHELLGTKRGVQLELALARIRRWNPSVRTWGISATLGNLDQALETLTGIPERKPSRPKKESSPIRLIEGYQRKKVKFESILPKTIDRFPWAGHIGTKMVPQVIERLESVPSALIFANTRSQTELWYRELLHQKPEWAGQIALHHGSLDTTVRQWVENGLREGRLRAVVCTSSLDLGVDFSAVDLVIQIGSPKGAARLLQRAGRSGHQPDAISRLAFVPTNAIELIELSAAINSIRAGRLEARLLIDKPYDVLAQHLVTIAVGGGFRSEDLLEEVRSTLAYRSLSQKEWNWILDFVVHGGSSLQAYPDYHRVERENGFYAVTQRKIATQHRMNIGTIVSDAAMQIKYLKGKALGSAEESFLSKLKAGEKFLFAGRLVEMVRVKDNVAYVRRTKGQPDSVPRWMGTRMPLSSELSTALRIQLQEASEGTYSGKEMRAVKPLLELQARLSVIPRTDELLIEKIKTRNGFQLFVFPLEGRLVHEGLAAIFAHRMSTYQKQSFSMACNDYGFVLQSPSRIPVEEGIVAGLLGKGELFSDITESMNATQMAKRQFRQIAKVAGLIHPGLPGRRKSASHVQASSNLFFDVFEQYDPENLLLEQSRREVLEQQLEATRMRKALERIENSRIVIREPERITPLSFPLLVDKLRERVSSETLADRVRRMQEELEKAVGP